MGKGYRVFNNDHAKSMSEWEKINQAIVGSDNKRKIETKDIQKLEEVVPEHNQERYTDESLAKDNLHWSKLGEYQVIDKGIHKWKIDEGGDRNSIYWPYIPNDAELMEEIYRDRPGARKMVNEHKKIMGHDISEEVSKQYHRREGF